MQSTISFEVWAILVLFAAVLILAFYSVYTRRRVTEREDSAYLQALKYMAEGESRRAVEKFKEAVRQDSTNFDAYIKLGIILRNEGLYKNAARIHQDLTLRGNLNAEQLTEVKKNLVLDYWHLKDFARAELFLNQLIEDKTQFDWAAPFLIKILEERKDWESAFELLSKSQLSKEDRGIRKMARFRVSQGQQLVDSGKEKEARVLFKEAQKIDPSCAESYLQLGDSYWREGRTSEAIKAWTELCKKDSDQAPESFERLEKAWFEKGQFSKIEELYMSMLEENPEYLPAIIALSEIYRKKGEHSQALKLLENASKSEVDPEQIKIQMIRVYIDKNQYKEASKLAMEVIENKA
jgi:lipopolysaccharide biosynthesis regulator YciM